MERSTWNVIYCVLRCEVGRTTTLLQGSPTQAWVSTLPRTRRLGENRLTQLAEVNPRPTLSQPVAARPSCLHHAGEARLRPCQEQARIGKFFCAFMPHHSDAPV
jgi:hypothetical protein